MVLEKFREKVAHGGRSSKKDLQIKWSLPRPESLGNVEMTWINNPINMHHAYMAKKIIPCV